MRRAFVLLILWALSACSPLDLDPPPVADSTLVDVLVELHLAEARAASASSFPRALPDSILARYGVTRETVEDALAQRIEDPEGYAALMRQVEDGLMEEMGIRSDGRYEPDVGGPADSF